MTVADLIARLQELPQHLPVYVPSLEDRGETEAAGTVFAASSTGPLYYKPERVEII